MNDKMTICETLEAISVLNDNPEIEEMLDYIELKAKSMNEKLEQDKIAIKTLHDMLDRKERLNTHYRTEIRQFERALDKACETIAFLTSDAGTMSSEQYKAVLMNEVSD